MQGEECPTTSRRSFLCRLATLAAVGLGATAVPALARAESGRCCRNVTNCPDSVCIDPFYPVQLGVQRLYVWPLLPLYGHVPRNRVFRQSLSVSVGRRSVQPLRRSNQAGAGVLRRRLRAGATNQSP
jgi:hypothetical protein